MLSVLRVERLLRRRLPLSLSGEVAHDAQQPPEFRATLAGEVAGAQGARALATERRTERPRYLPTYHTKLPTRPHLYT